MIGFNVVGKKNNQTSVSDADREIPPSGQRIIPNLIDYNKTFINLVYFSRKTGTPKVVDSAWMRFASEARPSQLFGLQSRLVCHYPDTFWVLRIGSWCAR